MSRQHLLDERPSGWQVGLIGAWLVNLAVIGIIWSTSSDFRGLAGWLDAAGMLFGLLAVYFALTQFMLMGRLPWLEGAFGLDRLAGYHRLNGYMAISFILIHPLFITWSYAVAAQVSPIRQYVDLIVNYPYVWLALIGEILFLAVVASSIYMVRRRLKFENWYFVHLAVYLAIIFSAIHPFFVSGSFAGTAHPLAKVYWLSLYGFVGLNLLAWRLVWPLLTSWQLAFRVERVVKETPSTTSVYITGRGLDRLAARPGQFVMVRVLQSGFWLQEHPFSLSLIQPNQLRLTIRRIGDYTSKVGQINPGSRLLISGPFGRFTEAVADTDKRLFIAGGVGITPLRPLAEQALAEGRHSILIYGNQHVDDVPLKNEMDQLAERGLELNYVFSDEPPEPSRLSGYIDLKLIKKLAPDYLDRDIYLCGPPAMMDVLIEQLQADGLAAGRLHFERFRLP
ncbi:MAG TPA: ferredoxin reductase family protein [Candidatus Saccharimonadales bacterium]|nr:ferredoxin reductase family protein [Candidatus Saccharimonadales bacterium]